MNIIGGVFIPFLSSFWVVLFCSMKTQPANNISQDLKQQQSPNTHTLVLSSTSPSGSQSAGYVNQHFSSERTWSSGYLALGQLCPPNNQPHTCIGATWNKLQVPETTPGRRAFQQQTAGRVSQKNTNNHCCSCVASNSLKMGAIKGIGGGREKTASQITPMRPWSENGVCLQLLMRCQTICFFLYCMFCFGRR